MLHGRLPRTNALSLWFGLATLGCGAPARSGVRLEAYSWWVRTSERHALQSVLDLYNSAHDDSEVFNPNKDATDADDVRRTLTARLLAGAPPSTFQANVGSDLLRWTVVDTADGNGASRIAPLGELYVRARLLDDLPEPLKNELFSGLDGQPYAVPLDIHRLNVLYYNTQNLATFQANYGQSFLDPNVLCPPSLKLGPASPGAKLSVRIALGTKDSFALVLFALESVLPAIAGAGLYDGLFRGHARGDWTPPVRQALRCVQYLSRSFFRDESWPDALAEVQAGRADFSVMGDWSNGELKSAFDQGTVDAVPFPGSEGTFVFTSDTFPLPLNAPYRSETEAFLDTLASPNAQRRFSADKGSIPARQNIDLTVLGPRALATAADFNSPEIAKVLATSGLFPPYFPSAELSDRLTAMTAPGAPDERIEDVIALLDDAQPLFERWQRRLGRWAPDMP
jgi:glucose/mannose transport system substrate-binding protein